VVAFCFSDVHPSAENLAFIVSIFSRKLGFDALGAWTVAGCNRCGTTTVAEAVVDAAISDVVASGPAGATTAEFETGKSFRTK